MFIQFLPVALGVYVGILAGNWNENRKIKKSQTEFINNVIVELESNAKSFAKSIEYHEVMEKDLDSLQSTMKPEDLESNFFASGGFQRMKNWRGTGIMNLRTTAYETGISGNLLNGLDFSTSSLLSGIYGGLKGYKQFTDPIMERMLYELNYDTKTKEITFIIELICSDVLGTEKVLKKRTEEAIAKLKNSK